MKVGGNESAKTFFQRNGGSAALNSKDPKTKYTSAAAVKYKEELQKRVEADWKRNPDGIVIEEADGEEGSGSGTSTPVAGGEDDFFSSWDKPAVKRASNPPSRTGTPSQAGRASPFLNPGAANGNGTQRPKSPLNPTENTPAASRAVPSAARKTTTLSSAKPKANILGGKKTKLGAKKVDASALDFDEAEKKAREEEERKAKLGYDPNDVETATPSEASIAAKQPGAETSTIHQPTPLSPGSRAGTFGNPKPRERSDSEMERLGMGVRKLGFGMVGQQKKPAAAAKIGGGFGSTSRAAPVEGTHISFPYNLYVLPY